MQTSAEQLAYIKARLSSYFSYHSIPYWLTLIIMALLVKSKPSTGEVYPALYYSIFFITIPLIIIIISIGYYLYLKRQLSHYLYHFLALLFATILITPHLVPAINCHLVKGKPILLQGLVVNQYSDSYTAKRSRKIYKYYLDIKPNNASSYKTLKVNEATYKKYKVLDNYNETWFKGSLGFLYR